MAVDLYCPHCDENLGKDTENPNPAHCSNCGMGDIKNPRGYSSQDDVDDIAAWRRAVDKAGGRFATDEEMRELGY